MYQASLKEKTRQMKAMASELNMYQAQVGRLGSLSSHLAKQLEKGSLFALRIRPRTTWRWIDVLLSLL